jgi:hypothetical protein
MVRALTTSVYAVVDPGTKPTFASISSGKIPGLSNHGWRLFHKSAAYLKENDLWFWC